MFREAAGDGRVGRGRSPPRRTATNWPAGSTRCTSPSTRTAHAFRSPAPRSGPTRSATGGARPAGAGLVRPPGRRGRRGVHRHHDASPGAPSAGALATPLGARVRPGAHRTQAGRARRPAAAPSSTSRGTGPTSSRWPTRRSGRGRGGAAQRAAADLRHRRRATAIWEERYLGQRPAEVRAAARWPDLYLLTDHDGVPFEQDGLRDGEHLREWMTGRFRATSWPARRCRWSSWPGRTSSGWRRGGGVRGAAGKGLEPGRAALVRAGFAGVWGAPTSTRNRPASPPRGPSPGVAAAAG